MTLATSCPSCGTVFKVVEDQLKISEGWVRCGHCHDVFNALEGLFDLDRRDSALQGLRTLPAPLAEDAPDPHLPFVPNAAPRAGGSAAPRAAAPTSVLEPPADTSGLPSPPPLAAAPAAAGLPGPALAAPAAGVPQPSSPASVPPPAPSPTAVAAQPAPAPAPAHSPPAAAGVAALAPAAAQARSLPPDDVYALDAQDTVIVDEHGLPATADESPELDPIRLDGTSDLSPLAESTPASQTDFDRLNEEVQASRGADALPAFVQEADRAARLNRPVRKRVLWSVVLLLTLLLGVQALLHQRDLIAARCESCAALLSELLPPLGLTLHAPAQIEAVEIDNAMLVQPPGVDGLRLTVLVRNKAQHAVAAPFLELALTDAQGALLLRRVLSPQDFRRPESLAAAVEETWELELQSAHKKIAGYTVAAFLP